MSQLLYHLEIILHSFFYALSLYIVSYLVKIILLLHEVVLYLAYGYLLLFLGSNKEIGRIYLVFCKRAFPTQGHSIKFLYAVYLVVPERYTQNILAISHCHIHRIAFYSEFPSLQSHIVMHILYLHKMPKEIITVYGLSTIYHHHAALQS